MEDYQDLQKPSAPKYYISQEDITKFVTDELMPEMEKLVSALRGEHKVDMWDLGRRANALKMRISDHLAAANRILREKNADVLSQVHGTRSASEGLGDKEAVEVVRARAKEKTASLNEVCERLEFYRDDLRSVIMFAQSGMRNIRDDEYGTNLS
jgi:hypothetical protein